MVYWLMWLPTKATYMSPEAGSIPAVLHMWNSATVFIFLRPDLALGALDFRKRISPMRSGTFIL